MNKYIKIFKNIIFYLIIISGLCFCNNNETNNNGKKMLGQNSVSEAKQEESINRLLETIDNEQLTIFFTCFFKLRI